MNSYTLLETTNVPVKIILQDTFLDLLKSIHRKLTTKETIRNNRCAIATVTIHKIVFLKFYKAIRDWGIDYGRSIKLERKKNSEIKKITIEFTHKGTFEHHFKKIIDVSVKKYLKKVVKDNTIGVKISEDSKAVLVFDLSKNKLTLSVPFIVKNMYGNIC